MGLRRNVFVEPEPQPFDIESERARRRQLVLDAKRDVDDANERKLAFQREHFSANASGQLVPKVSTGIINVFDIHQAHASLVRSWSAAVDRHQAALKFWNEIL